jgi:ribosomal protein S18 acetylase RimI-like enzyme
VGLGENLWGPPLAHRALGRALPVLVCRYFLDTDKVNAQYTPEFLAQRRADLEKWMQRLHKIPCVACFPIFLSFLEADKTESLKTYSSGLVPVLKGVTLDEATQVLAKSHMENPLWKHIFPLLSDKDLFEALNGVFGLFALTTFEYGYALSVKDGAQMNSVCLVIPPGSQVGHIDLAVAGLGKLSYKLGATAMATLQKVYTTMEEHHVSIMGRTPHWFIWYFGSDPNCHRQGHGGTLMERVLELVDESELPAYTECTDEKHKGFFAKYGFNVEEYHEQPTLSYMLRPANRGGGGGGGAVAVPAPAPAPPVGQSRPASPDRAAAAPAPAVVEDEDSDDDAI